MSVPEGKREEGKFHLEVKARELAVYTMRITANENVFLPSYQRSLTDDIISQAKESYLLIRKANDIKVRIGTEFQLSDWHKRERIQKEVVERLNRLLRLMDLAHSVFHLSSKRVKYWGKITIEVRNGTSSWMKSDTERYS